MQRKAVIIVIVILFLLLAGILYFMKPQKRSFEKAVTPQAREDLEITEISATLQEEMSSGVGGTVGVGKKKDSNTLVITISAAKSANLTASIKNGECSNLGEDAYQLGMINANPQSFDIEESKEGFISKLPLSVVLQDDQAKMLSCGTFSYEDESEEAEEANRLYQ